MSNHPVHIVDSQGMISPSSFIPFCDFGGNMSAMGEKIDLFDLPVCNSFKPKLLEGQLCYQVDVNEVKDQVDTQKAIKHGMVVILDYNEDKMITEDNAEVNVPLLNNLHDILSKEDKALEAKFYIETLGSRQNDFVLYLNFNILLQSVKEPLSLSGEGNYGLTDVKEIDVTEAFLGLEDKTRLCQSKETLGDCRMKKYLKEGVNNCKCIPFGLRNYSNDEVIS